MIGAQNINTMTKSLAMSDSNGLRMASTTAQSQSKRGIRIIKAINQTPVINISI